jgi:hypothetical protein
LKPPCYKQDEIESGFQENIALSRVYAHHSRASKNTLARLNNTK